MRIETRSQRATSLPRNIACRIVASLFRGVFPIVVNPVMLVVTLVGIGFGIGVVFSGTSYLRLVKADLRRLATEFRVGVTAATGHSLDTIQIDIKQQDWRVIEYERKRRSTDLAGLTDGATWVPATIRHRGDSHRCKVRLKGTYSDHWTHPYKWSLQIRVVDNTTFFGMKRFSIQCPSTRDYAYEYLYQKTLEHEGLLFHRCQLVHVKLNGQSRGLFFLEEIPGKRMIESQRYRDGPIVRFSKDRIRHRIETGTKFKNYQSSEYHLAAVTALQYESGLSIERDNLVKLAVHQLTAFQNGALTVSDVFAIDELAKVAALRVFFGSKEFDWRDVYFYLNPLTLKLHPIDKEIHKTNFLEMQWWREAPFDPDTYPFLNALFADDSFTEHFVRALKEVAQLDFVRRLQKDLGQDCTDYLASVRTEFRMATISWGELKRNAKLVDNCLKPRHAFLAYAEFVRDQELGLAIVNCEPLPIEIRALVLGTGERISFQTKWRIPGGQGRVGLQSALKRTVMGKFGLDRLQDLRVVYSVIGSDVELDASLQQWPTGDYASHDMGDVRHRVTDAASFFACGLQVNHSDRTITLVGDKCQISQPLVVPRGYVLNAEPGAIFHFMDDGLLVCHGALRLAGTIASPILLSATSPAGAILVMGASRRSLLRHVSCKGLSAMPSQLPGTTSAITFYHSDVLIQDCLFQGNQDGDDYLNVVRAKCTMARCRFSEINADAVDFDFVEGRIDDCTFTQCGNDAIDVSGSVVVGSEIVIDGAQDKGVSAGEESRIEFSGLRVMNSAIAIASKDGSVLRVDNGLSADCNVGAASYKKKPEYGAASVVLKGFRMKDVEVSWMRDPDCEIVRDGKWVVQSINDVEAQMYGKVFGKASQ